MATDEERREASTSIVETVCVLGEVDQWPGGYAMSLGLDGRKGGVVRCCQGHETPEDARAHGLIRLVQVASEVADRDVTAWATPHVAEPPDESERESR
jgi:hypothetical protein